MLQILKAIIISLNLLCVFPALAQEEKSTVILDLKDYPDDKPRDYYQLYKDYIADVQFYDKRYPQEQIEEDFIDDVKQAHPEYSFDTAAVNEYAIRLGVRSWRIYNNIKQKIQDFMLDKDVPPLKPKAKDNVKYQYQDYGDKALIITGFDKPEISPQELEAYQQKIQQREKIKQAVLAGDWKTVFSYAFFGGKEIEDKHGQSTWSGTKQVEMRLLSAVKSLKDDTEIHGGLQIYIHPNTFLLSQEFLQYEPLFLHFDNSDNLDDIKLNWPLPQRLFVEGNALVGYAGNVVVPFTAKLKTAGQPLTLIAEMEAVACAENICLPQKLKSELLLAVGDGEKSRVAGFLQLADLYAPHAQSEELDFTALYVENPALSDSNPWLVVEMAYKGDASDFDIFIQDNDGLKFGWPLTRIEGNKIVSKFEVLNGGNDLVGHKFELTARLRPNLSIRRQIVAEASSPLSAENSSVTFGLLIMSAVTGLLLNFIPSVLPFTLLKIISFAGLSKINRTSPVRRGALFNLGGIFFAVAGLAVIISFLQHYHIVWSWGTQLHNVLFLAMMFWFWLFFIFQTVGLINLRLNFIFNFFARLKLTRSDIIAWGQGIAIVITSTLISIPYLERLVNTIAVSADITITFAILSAIASGLAIPYFILALKPNLSKLFNFSHKWWLQIRKLLIICQLFMIIWLFLLLAAISSFWGTVWLAAAAFLCLLVINIREQAVNYIRDDKEFTDVRTLTIWILNILAVIVIMSVIAFSVWFTAPQTEKTDVMVNDAETDIVAEAQYWVKQGNIVLVKVSSDWCMLCHYNDFAIYSGEQIQDFYDDNKVVVREYNQFEDTAQVMSFMERYGRMTLPLYVLFSPHVPEGMVLPPLVVETGLREIIRNQRS